MLIWVCEDPGMHRLIGTSNDVKSNVREEGEKTR